MDAKLDGRHLQIDTESLIAALPLDVKRDLVASVFADEEFIARVVDVLTTGITTEDVGSLYSNTLGALQTRLAETWPVMARDLIRALVLRLRFESEYSDNLREHMGAWQDYYAGRGERPSTEKPLPTRAVSAGISARDAEIDRIIAVARAAEREASGD